MSALVSEKTKEDEIRSVILFGQFLEKSNIPPLQPIDQYKSLEQIVKENFHLYTEDILRGVIAAALEYRDKNNATSTKSNALGDWGLIIDTIKVVLQQKRENAGNHFQELLKYGMAGDQQNVDKFLLKLYRGHHVDHLLIGILEETMAACQQSGNEENFYMIQYFMSTIDSIRENEAKIRQALSKKATDIAKTTSPSTTTTSKSTSTTSKTTEVVKTELPTKVPAVPSPSTEESAMIAAGAFFNDLIKRSSGNIQQVQDELLRILTQNIHPIPVLQQVIADNITACEKANYTNKLKLFQFMQKVIEKHLKPSATPVEHSLQQLAEEQKQQQQLQQLSHINSYHAPQFVTNNTLYDQTEYTQTAPGQATSWKKKLAPVKVDEKTCFDGRKFEFYNNPNAAATTATTATNTKMNPKKLKATKKLYKSKLVSLIDEINQHMEKHGYAVIENFVALDLVKRVRIESMLFKEFYEKSEIWIGKEANIGAHLVVPSIRGDQVLWMCGGHNVFQVDNPQLENGVEDANHKRNQQHFAPEGISRVIKTSGEVEPCKLEVKASAPTRRFHALKELIHKCDSFVNSLKSSNSQLAGIFERSDAMIAIYPGEGARFANHVDNTTFDGRRVTMVTYLNPDWTEAMGGALRITGRLQRKPFKTTPTDAASVSTASTTTTSTTATTPAPSANIGSQSDAKGNSAAVDSDDEEGDGDEHLPTIVTEAQLIAETTAAATSDKSSANSSVSEVKEEALAEQPVIDVLPIAGRSIIFYSSEIPHEVLPSFGDRYAMTIWYYDREERQHAIQQAKDAAAAAAATRPNIAASKANMHAQTEAKDFIGLLMGDNEFHKLRVKQELQAEGSLPVDPVAPENDALVVAAQQAAITADELKFLQQKVVQLSQDAVEIVASITGAPSVQSFRDGFAMLTTTDIVSMRALFRKMGLHE